MAEIFFNGPAGRIEGYYINSKDPKAPIALILHSHPLYGGSMHNKIVYNINKILSSIGFTTLRINFRGVGRSQGLFDHGVGEITDGATALDWLQLNNPLSSFSLIVGFSFGSWIAMQLIMRRPEISKFIAISPPINQYDFSFIFQCPVSGLIVHGDKDSIVSESLIIEFYNKISKQKFIKIDYITINNADHFFRGKINEFNIKVYEYIVNKLLI